MFTLAWGSFRKITKIHPDNRDIFVFSYLSVKEDILLESEGGCSQSYGISWGKKNVHVQYEFA